MILVVVSPPATNDSKTDPCRNLWSEASFFWRHSRPDRRVSRLCAFVSRVMQRPHHTEAAAHAGLNVAAAERGHFTQLPGDLDSLVEQKAEVALVRQAPGTRHLPEQVCNHQRWQTAEFISIHSCYFYCVGPVVNSSTCMCLCQERLFTQQIHVNVFPNDIRLNSFSTQEHQEK